MRNLDYKLSADEAWAIDLMRSYGVGTVFMLFKQEGGLHFPEGKINRIKIEENMFFKDGRESYAQGLNN